LSAAASPPGSSRIPRTRSGMHEYASTIHSYKEMSMNNLNLNIEVLENVETPDWVDFAIGVGIGIIIVLT
jgi:hypothetical protein